MNKLETLGKQPSVPDLENENRILLEALRERLKNDPTVYFAGELTNANDDGSRFDIHEFFVAPTAPLFDPAKLTAFYRRILSEFDMTILNRADEREDGEMQLPRAFVDQHIGDRETKVLTLTTTKTKIGSFEEQTEETVDEEDYFQKLMQRTMVNVYTDPFLAQTLYDFCDALQRKELDEEKSTNLFGVYATHIITAEHLAGLKEHYQSSGNDLPQLPLSK